ncbi:MAG TPA: response regulator [Polyangiaceae bacterium]|nr:response regulator [Polyangiaceae bacterium]
MTDPNRKPSSPKTVLLVDDSEYWTETIADGLRKEGYVVSVLHDGLAAVERVRRAPPQILITDYFLANLDGGKLCQLAKRAKVTPPITTIILTGGADRKHSRAPSAYADAVIAKNNTDIVFDDLRRALNDLSYSIPPPGDGRPVIGHERLEPRVIASKLHGLKQYLDALHEGIGDAVLGVDRELRVYFLNSVALDVFGLDEDFAIARPVQQVLNVAANHPLIERIRSSLETGGSPRTPLTLERDGITLRVTVAGLPSPDGQASALIIARDLSDLRAAEQARMALDARLHQADKLASLGHLVAGISHEVNNPLAAILLNLRDLQDTFPELEKVADISRLAPDVQTAVREMPRVIQESLEAAERIRSIVAEMRLFAHPSGPSGEKARMEELLEAPLALAANEVRFKARVIRNLDETPEIVVDRTRLSQAFLNIILNAAQAIEPGAPEQNYIRVETFAEMDGVVVEIENSGPPIPPEVLPRIFEPFFTTKPVGQGVGLGLSIAYDTVRRHGGHIEVSSEAGRPTVFRVRIPRNTGVSLSPPADRSEPPVATPARVLIVDDERVVRNGLRRILERQNEVVLAPSGERALEILGADDFDVVLCDLIMPGMTGIQLYEETRKRTPAQAARFVFLTGGTSSVEAREFLRGVSNPRAYKPVSADEILRLVARSAADFRASASR